MNSLTDPAEWEKNHEAMDSGQTMDKLRESENARRGEIRESQHSAEISYRDDAFEPMVLDADIRRVGI